MKIKLKKNNGFTLKSGGTSPFKVDPGVKKTPSENSDFSIVLDETKDVNGVITRKRERENVIVTDASKAVEKKAINDQTFLAGFESEYSKAKADGFVGTLPQYIKQKEIDLGYAGKKEVIKEERVETEQTTPAVQTWYPYETIDYTQENWKTSDGGKEMINFYTNTVMPNLFEIQGDNYRQQKMFWKKFTNLEASNQLSENDQSYTNQIGFSITGSGVSNQLIQIASQKGGEAELREIFGSIGLMRNRDPEETTSEATVAKTDTGWTSSN
jgi:hypothetical protein